MPGLGQRFTEAIAVCSTGVGSRPSALTTRFIEQLPEVEWATGMVAETTWAVPRTGLLIRFDFAQSLSSPMAPNYTSRRLRRGSRDSNPDSRFWRPRA